MPNATTNAILDNARANLPGVADDVIRLALFNTCDDLAREALRTSPPTDVDADPASWLPGDQWAANYQVLLSGVLGNLYGQVGKPYYNADIAKFFLDRYTGYRTASRTTAAGAAPAVDTIPERIVSTVRAQIQAARDESIKLEMFNAIQKIRIEAYGLAPLKGADTDYTTWLTAEQYEEAYLAILHGTLYRLYGQSNMPWYNTDLYQSQFSLYNQELDLVRNANIEPEGGLDSLLDEVKPHLPGARDDVLRIELRRAADEFLKVTQVWEEEISFRVHADKVSYELDSDEPNAAIVRLLSVVNGSDTPVKATMRDIPVLVLGCAPSTDDTYVATVALSIDGAGSCSSCNKPKSSCSCGNSLGFPDWIFSRWHEVFFDGLIGRMMIQPAKPYTSTLSEYHLKRFRAGMAEARSAARRQNLYAGQRWRFPEFA